MTDFSQFYSKEKNKAEIRAAIEMIAADAVQHLSADYVAHRLMTLALDLGYNFKAKKRGGWVENALVSLRRLRDGKIETDEDLLREIANRNLNAKPGPTVN